MKLFLHNSISGKKEEFKPIDARNVRMYVCGPTVYDRPHIGNARAVVVYDVLFRILKELYGEKSVTYVRNITDVDDKINKAAKENRETIQNLTSRITKLFHDDMAALNNLAPTHEPKATENVENIINLIQKIIDNGNAYISENHVLLNVSSIKKTDDYHYGILSGKNIEANIAGARIEVENYKNNPEDFVLWKPASKDDDASSVFDSPWGKGRPGWHIECSAMSSSILGNDFDIHGGGADLKFPHHENEIAQSKCAHPESHYANYWVHNGFVTVNGEKMSKSLGNFTTVHDLLEKGWHGETIRLALLSTHYRKPLDFNDKTLEDAKKTLDKFYGVLKKITSENLIFPFKKERESYDDVSESIFEGYYKDFLEKLYDDMNISSAFSILHYLIEERIHETKELYMDTLFFWKSNFQKMCDLLGICQLTPEQWFAHKQKNNSNEASEEYILQKISERAEAKKNKNFILSDQIRNELLEKGIILKDTKDGTEWSFA